MSGTWVRIGGTWMYMPTAVIQDEFDGNVLDVFPGWVRRFFGRRPILTG